MSSWVLVLILLVASWAFLALTLGLAVGAAVKLADRRQQQQLDRIENRLDEVALNFYPDDDEDLR